MINTSSFSIMDTLRRIEIYPCVIYWIQKACLLYFLFDEYNYAILK